MDICNESYYRDINFYGYRYYNFKLYEVKKKKKE